MKKLFKKTPPALMIALILLGSLPIPVKADPSATDLKLGGEEATSWNIANIYPGQSGTKTVTLHNAGYLDGFVTIWITDIKETDFAGNGARLDDYVFFDVSADRLTTNLSFPMKIDKFPKDASGNPNYLRINSLKAGETISLVWRWHFLAEAGNEAQGDGFSFTINYMLEETPPPSEDDEEQEVVIPLVILPPLPEPMPPVPPEPPQPTPPAPEPPQPTPPAPPATPIPPTPNGINWLLIIAGALIFVVIGYFIIRRIRKRKHIKQ